MVARDLAVAKRMKRSLRGEVFRGQRIAGVDLATVDLREVRFEEVHFTLCDLAGADLRGAQFIVCTMNSIILRDVILGDNRFYGTTLVEPIELAEEARRTIERCGGSFPPPDGLRRPRRLP
jgi:uncharacterized protein YjbI with pentapeptide repeats